MALSTANPIKVNDVFNLANLGINPTNIGFATLTMESPKYICIREPAATPEAKAQIAILDVSQPQNIVRRPITADNAIMHPTENILALKAGNQLQVFNMERKEKLKAYTLPDPVVFWKWVDANTIGMVTAASVFHWKIDGPEEPEKVFDRHSSLSDSQIINYRTDGSGKWLCLVGISQKEGRIVGSMQLFSVEKNQTQPLEGHACAFGSYIPDGCTKPSTLFTFAKRSATESKLYIIEVSKPDENPTFQKRNVDLPFPMNAAQDFPVAMQVSNRWGVIYLVTKFGYLHVYDLETGTPIWRNQVSQETIFVTAQHEATGGMLGVDRKGRVIAVNVDEAGLVPFLRDGLQNFDLAIRKASVCGLPGAEELFVNQFNKLFAMGDYKNAAKVAAESPKGMLRTPKTIQMFQQLPTSPGQPSPLLQYFGVVMEKGKLNNSETMELARPVIAQGRKELIDKWLKEDKLGCSEELGDIVKPLDAMLALSIYFKANAHAKVLVCLAETGQYDKIVPYCQKVNFKADWMSILNPLMSLNPEAAGKFALNLASAPGGSLIDVNQVTDAFIKREMIQQTTALLLEYLKNNKPEEGNLQTKLLEINLIRAPNVAEAIFAQNMFSHFDKQKIGQLCERAGLYQRALTFYKDINDVKRVMTNTQGINPEFLVNYFSDLDPNDALECLKNLLRLNMRANLQLVVQICTKYSAALKSERVIELFDQFKAVEGLFFYLGGIVGTSQDQTVHNKYIEAAVKTGQGKEVERMCKESNYYDPKFVRDLLKEAKLPDQLPLIIVCDRFDFVDDLTKHLYKNNMSRYIEVYVQRINPSNTPAVVGALIDTGCNEDYIKNLLLSVRSMCPVEPLVEVVEKRNKLKLIQAWLEARVNEGAQEKEVHNALAKIVIDNNKNAEEFLTNNRYYDHKVIGKYCEKRDPQLAVLAYKAGQCDAELIEVTNNNGLFKQQARYLVHRQSLELWDGVLKEENEHRRSLIDAVVQTALPEVEEPEEVTMTVRAFINAKLPNELIELLDKIVSSKNVKFSQNPNLQELLIVTAIRVDQTRVKGFITKLDKYNPNKVAQEAIDANLFEEAFTVYDKFKMNVEAVGVLLNQMKLLDRAAEFAERHNMPDVFKELGKAQLSNGNVKQAIASFLRADDSDFADDVIFEAHKADCYEELVKFLEMCHKKMKSPKIESELTFAYAKTHKISEMETFISTPGNTANLLEIGDRCFDHDLFEPAKILYTHINNWPKLAAALVRMGDFSGAVDAAKKANSIRTWKEVNLACVEAKEFRLAQVAGIQVLTQGDDIEEIVRVYETRGFFNEVIQLCEAGIKNEAAPNALFTELACLYSKFMEEKLMEFLKNFVNKVTAPKVIHYCHMNSQWAELVFLYNHEKQYDDALLTMINHSAEAWDHTLFKEAAGRCVNMDNSYKAVQFYLGEQPSLVNELLNTLSNQIDPSRLVALVKKMNLLPLIKPYLLAIQEKNVSAVNDALNELFIEEEDYLGLRASIDSHNNFDALALAGVLEKHSLLEFRRIAAHIYKKNGKFQQSIELSKQDKLYKDAIQAAADSKKADVAESLMEFFVKNQLKECFAAALYTCYDLLKPDVVLELAWRHQITDMVFPYMIQVLREYTNKVDVLHKELEGRKKEEEKKNSSPESFVPDPSLGLFNNTLAITYYPNNPVPPMNMNMGGINSNMNMNMNMNMGGMNNNMNNMGGF